MSRCRRSGERLESAHRVRAPAQGATLVFFSRALLRLSLFLLFSSLYAAPTLERWRGEIRNGSRAPQTISLSARQQRAIGWFYDEVPGEPFCTGTLITPELVLTARHCFEARDDREAGGTRV